MSRTAMNLEKMSLAELKSLHADVGKAIASFESRKKSEALAAIEAAAKASGYTLSELFGGKATKTRKAVAPKYAHPENKSLTWTGRGRKPLWVVDALGKGKSLDDLAI
jgi:DNA-binding protein H-NS